jgi:hypothetical protein
MSATTTQLLSSGEFCKLRYDTITVKSASADVSFYYSTLVVSVFMSSFCVPVYSLTFWHRSFTFNSNKSPEAASAIIELLLMGGKTPETC